MIVMINIINIMDYRICNARTWSFHMSIHTGGTSVYSLVRRTFKESALTKFDSGEISGRSQRLAGSRHQPMWWPNSIVFNLTLESQCSRSAPPRLQTGFRSAATEYSVIHFYVIQINNINRYWNRVCTLYVLSTLRTSLSGILKSEDVVNQCLEFAFYPDTSHFVPQDPYTYIIIDY